MEIFSLSAEVLPTVTGGQKVLLYQIDTRENALFLLYITNLFSFLSYCFGFKTVVAIIYHQCPH